MPCKDGVALDLITGSGIGGLRFSDHGFQVPGCSGHILYGFGSIVGACRQRDDPDGQRSHRRNGKHDRIGRHSRRQLQRFGGGELGFQCIERQGDREGTDPGGERGEGGGDPRILIDKFRRPVRDAGQQLFHAVHCRAQVVTEGNGKVVDGIGQLSVDELRGVGHRLIGFFRRAGGAGHLLIHLRHDIVKVGNALGHNGVGSLAGLLRRPKPHERFSVSVNRIGQHLQNIAEGPAVLHELSEAPAGLLLQYRADLAAGIAQLIEHTGKIGRRLGGRNTASGKLHIRRGNILEVYAIRRAGRNGPAHGGGQFVDRCFAKILRLDQNIADAADSGSLQLVGIQGGSQHIRRAGQVGETGDSQLVGLLDKCDRILRCHTAGDGLIDRLRYIGRRHGRIL